MFKNSNFDEHQYEIYDFLRDMIIDEIPKVHPVRILEIGCGCGHMSKSLAQKFVNSKIVSVEIVAEYVKLARKYYSNYSNIQFGCKNYKDLSSKFDLIVLFLSFSELLKKDKLNTVVEKLYSLCNENASIVIVDEFRNDYTNELKLTYQINKLILI